MKNRKPADPVTPIEHYWLIAGQVHFSTGDGTDFHRNLNCIIKTERQAFTHANMAKSQQLLQMRLVSETYPEAPPAGFKITDVFLMGVSHLGYMTQTQFAEGFSDLVAEQTKAAEVLENLRKNGAQLS